MLIYYTCRLELTVELSYLILIYFSEVQFSYFSCPLHQFRSLADLFPKLRKHAPLRRLEYISVLYLSCEMFYT